jgi:phosphorylcholine metabolism protein LicD
MIKTDLSEFILLKEKNPAIARFLEIWSQKNENRNFIFSSEKDQIDFYEAILEISKCIISSSKKASLIMVPNKDGVETLYIKVVSK